MSGIPPANIVAGIAQTTVSQKKRTDEKNAEEKQRAAQSKELATLTDQKEHQVEDTILTEDTRVRKHDDEESHQQQQHRHRAMPEDEQTGNETLQDEDAPEHIDLQA